MQSRTTHVGKSEDSIHAMESCEKPVYAAINKQRQPVEVEAPLASPLPEGECDEAETTPPPSPSYDTVDRVHTRKFTQRRDQSPPDTTGA